MLRVKILQISPGLFPTKSFWGDHSNKSAYPLSAGVTSEWKTTGRSVTVISGAHRDMPFGNNFSKDNSEPKPRLPLAISIKAITKSLILSFVIVTNS